MVDSTNPRIMADNIRKLEVKIKANDVVANPTGDTTADLTKIEIDGIKYAIVGETTAEDVSYDNTDSGLTADDVQAAIDEVSANPVIVRDTYTGTTNASGAVSIPSANAPLEKTINIICISPANYSCNYAKGTTTYGVKVRDRDSWEPLASTECVFEIWKIK